MAKSLRAKVGTVAFSCMWAGLVASSSSLTACLSFAPVLEEPLRVGNVRDLSPDMLALRPGTTTLAEARGALVKQGMTGIVTDTFADTTGPSSAVIAADYQSRVHLFVDDRYEASITLPTHGLPPYGMAVRLGLDGTERVLLVLYRDPLARSGEPPTLLLYRKREHGFELASRTALEAQTLARGGMTQPMLLGSDLDAGVMLVARDQDGALWDASYLFRMENGSLTVKEESMMEAMRCSCVRRYALGVRTQ